MRDSATSSSQAVLESTFDFQRPSVLGSRPAPAPLLNRLAGAHRAVSSDSRYRYGHAPSALPSAQAIGASHRRKPSAQPGGSEFSGDGVKPPHTVSVPMAEHRSGHRQRLQSGGGLQHSYAVVCPLSVNPSAGVIPGFLSCCTVRYCPPCGLGSSSTVAPEPAGRPPP